MYKTYKAVLLDDIGYFKGWYRRFNGVLPTKEMTVREIIHCGGRPMNREIQSFVNRNLYATNLPKGTKVIIKFGETGRLLTSQAGKIVTFTV